MKNTIKYTLGAVLSIPLLPVLYVQGKKVRTSVPELPEATGNVGRCEQPTTKNLRLLVLGESTMAGVGVATHKEGFGGTLAQELSNKLMINVDWKVYAKSGYTAKDVTLQILPIIEESKVDLIVIGLGGNDAFSLNSPRTWTKNISVLLREIQVKFPEVPIVFANMPPIKMFPAFTHLMKLTLGNLVEMLGEELNTLVREFDRVYYSASIITLEKWTDQVDSTLQAADFYSDGVHPSGITYQAWGRDLADFIVSNEEICGVLEE